MKLTYTVIFIVGFLTAVSKMAFAQSGDEAVELGNVVITATRTPVPLAQAASSVTVIDSKTMEEKHLRMVLEALRDVSGMDIVQQGGMGGVTSDFLRGTNSNHTLVLIDGVQVNSPTTGAFDFSNLTVENIERVEIVRGPQSALYGSDAIGGVIQIFTRKGEGPTTSSVSFEGGSFGTYRETFEIAGSAKGADYSFSAGRIDTEGFSRASEKAGNTEKDGYSNTTLSSRVGLKLPRNARLEGTVRFSDSQADLDGCDPVTFFCPVDDPNFVQGEKTLTTALGLEAPVKEWWDQQLKLSLNTDHLTTTDPDTASNNFRIDTRSRSVDWQHTLQLGPLDILTIGYQYESQEGEDPGNFDKSLANSSGYGFNQLRLAPMNLNLGVRFDHNNQFGDETTYKAEAAYALERTGSRIRAAYGTGFHGPTINDLFFPGFGNPNLKPEKSRSVEGGIEQDLLKGSAKISATYFYTLIDDLIVFVFDPLTSTGMPENVQKARIIGTELEVQWAPIKATTLSARYTFTQAENRTSDSELPRRPKHKAGASLSAMPSKDLNVNLDLRYVGDRFDNTPNTVSLKDYFVVNLAGTYYIIANAQAFARIENLFNSDYQEVAGYGTAGLSAYGGIKFDF